MATTQRPVSRKRQRQISINGERKRFGDDVHSYLSEFASVRGITIPQAIEYIIRRVKDYFPPLEKVTIKDVENG